MKQKPQEADLEQVKSLLRRLDDQPQSGAPPSTPAPASARPEQRFPMLVHNDAPVQPVPLRPPPPAPLPLEPDAPVQIATDGSASKPPTSGSPAKRLILTGALLVGAAAAGLAWLSAAPPATGPSLASLSASGESKKSSGIQLSPPAAKALDGPAQPPAAASPPAPAAKQDASAREASPAPPQSPNTIAEPALAPAGASPRPAEAKAEAKAASKAASLVDRPEQPAWPSPPAPPAPRVAPPPVLPEAVIHDEALIRRLIVQGQEVLDQGHVMSARLLFRRAAESGSAEAALLLGDTFDPERLKSIGVRGLAGDIEQSVKWYEKADELGATAAKARLSALAGR